MSYMYTINVIYKELQSLCDYNSYIKRTKIPTYFNDEDNWWFGIKFWL